MVHEECTRKRTAEASKGTRNVVAQGRPLGHLAAWLQAGEDGDILDSAAHKARKPRTFGKERREKAWEWFRKAPGADKLEEKEAGFSKRRGRERSEPATAV